jgi:hypothetical protein
MLAWTCKQKPPMAKNAESILAKLSASEALMDDGFVVCCRFDDKCETSVREDWICCIVRRNTVIYGRIVNQDSMTILHRGHH